MVLKPNMTRAEIESATPRWRHTDIYTIEAAILDTFIISLDARDASLTDAIKDHGYWESWITAWHTRNVKPGMLYIDGGANCGYYSFLAAYLGATVWAFEPNPRYIELIKRSREGSQIPSNCLSIIGDALSNQVGTANLNFFDNLDGSASIVAKTDNSIEVKTTTLDQINKHNIVNQPQDIVLKLDIEGAEELALRGANQFISRNNVTIILEYTPKAYSEHFWRLLEGYGQITMVDFDGNEVPITHGEAESHTDWITLCVRSK